ncbi:uncharacterized protein LOC112088902 [Eutrema salsugineum]|uniref:uncharacterized protein LOC112088902 n=1 Tax=Eutrema salsugineum TaxID=72664 RepID=UPI000CED1EE0|nr:uncharacterized protein LOC112088902 [Eutrema salsugineum]
MRQNELSLEVGDEVYLKLRVFRGNKRHQKLKKLKPMYMGPYPIVERIGEVAYLLQLPQELSELHDVLHISLLRKVVREPEFILPNPPIDLEGNKVDGKKTKIVKIRWVRDSIREETWELEQQMRYEYPELFPDEMETNEEGMYLGTNSF